MLMMVIRIAIMVVWAYKQVIRVLIPVIGIPILVIGMLIPVIGVDNLAAFLGTEIKKMNHL
jgi:uncharacterized membrane protein (Fun14 family)